MSIPGNAEPGEFFGQQQQVQQQHSINFSSAIPIKKRRIPVFHPCSPPREEKPSILDDDLKNKEESIIQDGGMSSSEARNTGSKVNSDVVGPSVIAVKKEVAPTDTPLGQANVDILAPKPVEAKPRISLGPLDDLGNKKVILQGEKSSEPDSSMITQTADVKQEIVSGQTEGTGRPQLSRGKMNIELSLGPKEPVVPALGHQQNNDVSHKTDKSDSLLSLAIHKEKLVLCEKKDTAMDTASNPVCSNRSNWDLNTTMDVWEGSTRSEAFAHGLVNIGEFCKTDGCNDDKSSLTTASAACFGSDKGKHILDGHISGSSKSSTLHFKTDDSLRLRLAMPFMETSRGCASLSDNLAFTSVGPNLSLKQVQLPVVNVSRTVKSEPVDDNSKHDCSIGSCSSTNTGSMKLSSVKRECANNHSLETVLQSSISPFQSSISPEKSDDHRSMKSEVVQEHNQAGCKSKDTAMVSVARVMQHQESCASSSAMPLPVSLLPQCSSPARLPTCSELTTSGDFSNQSEQSFHSKESHRNDIPDELTAIPIRQGDNQFRQCKLGISSVVDQDKCELARIDENTVELCQNDDVTANGEEKIKISSEMVEEDSFGSDGESQQNCAADTICGKEDEEYEDGEVREPVQHSAEGDSIVEGKSTDNLDLVKSDSQNLQPSVPSAVFKEKDDVKKNLDETHGDPIKDYGGICYEPNNGDILLQKSYEVSEVVADEKRAIIVTPDKQLDMSGEDVRESPRKQVSRDFPTDGSLGDGAEIGCEAIAEEVKENCPGEDDLTLPKVEVSPNGHDATKDSNNDAAKDSNNAGNKSRIINLSRPSVMAAPFKTKSISNRLLTTRSGKERYSDFDGGIHPRGNRDEFYTGGSNKFVKDRIHDQSVRNSRPTFMLGKGRTSGRFGSFRGEWDSEHDFGSESSYGPSDYRLIRRKHASSISDIGLERNGYNIPQEGNALGGNRRKTMNDEFPSLRRGSLRRLSSGDRDGPVTRGFQMLHRIPRNMSPRRCSGEAGSDMIGLRNDDKFMQHLPEDIINPVYGHPQAMYDELDSQLVRGNRNFSTTLQRKGYPRIRSKSPVRSRSPGPWSSPRRRSPNGVQELSQHRSPALYRMGRIRGSPDHACFHDEMVARRRGSPSYVARHNNDLRDVDSGREHIHPRPTDSNRRSSPGRGFPRSARRADALDSREMGDGDEYLNGPSHPNKFHELRGEGNIDERRKFIERRGPPHRSFRPHYNTENDNFRFHLNDGPRPYRFCPDADTEFVERSNAREREFDGRIKHENLAVSRRIRNIEEQQDGNYRPVERVWHDDGFTDARVKRRRF